LWAVEEQKTTKKSWCVEAWVATRLGATHRSAVVRLVASLVRAMVTQLADGICLAVCLGRLCERIIMHAFARTSQNAGASTPRSRVYHAVSSNASASICLANHFRITISEQNLPSNHRVIVEQMASVAAV
jgi:hypothetical protein